MEIRQTGLGGNIDAPPATKGSPRDGDAPSQPDSVTLDAGSAAASVTPAFIEDTLKDGAPRVPDAPPPAEEKRSLSDAAQSLLTPSKLWSITLPSSGVGFHGSLITKDGALCSGHDETLTCVDPNSGAILWQHEFDELIGSLSMEMGRDGTIFAVLNSRENQLCAIDPSSGNEKWTLPTHRWDCAPHAGPDGAIYAEKNDNLLVLNGDGTRKAQFKPKGKDNRIHRVAGIDREGNCFIKCNDAISAVSPAGRELWNIPGNSIELEYFSHDPAHLYQHRDFEISQIDKNSGEKTWKVSTILDFPLQYHTFLGLYRDRLILAGNKGEGDGTKLMCMDASTGKTLWTGKRNCDFELFCDDGKESLLFTGGKKRIDRIDPATGKEIWTFRAQAQPVWAGTLSQDGILFVSAGDTVYGLDKEKGEKKFTYRTGSPVKDLILSSDESMLFIREEDDNRLTAVRLKAGRPGSGGSQAENDSGKIQVFEELVDIGGVKILRRR